jgi:hypothetical protein
MQTRKKFTRKMPQKISPADKFQTGIKVADSMVRTWNKAGKTTFSIKGHRIHHGTAGTVLFVLGTITGSPGIAGIGWGLMKDDITDAKKWFSVQ